MLNHGAGGGGAALRSGDRGENIRGGWRSGQAGNGDEGRESEGRVQRGQRRRRQKAKGPSLGQQRRKQLARRVLSQQRNGHPELLKHGKRGQEEQKPAALAPRVPPSGASRPGGLSHAPRVWCHLPARCCLRRGSPLLSLEAPPSPSWEVRARAAALSKLGPVTSLLPCVPVGKSAHAARGNAGSTALLLRSSPPNAGSDRVTTPWLSWGWSLGEGACPTSSPGWPHAGSGSTAGITTPVTVKALQRGHS